MKIDQQAVIAFFIVAVFVLAGGLITISYQYYQNDKAWQSSYDAGVANAEKEQYYRGVYDTCYNLASKRLVNADVGCLQAAKQLYEGHAHERQSYRWYYKFVKGEAEIY